MNRATISDERIHKGDKMKRMLPKVLEIIREHSSNDPDVIANNLGIRVHYRALPIRIKGLLVRTPLSRDVVINSKIDTNHKKIALAHELGHVFLHKGGFHLFEINLLTAADKHVKEYEANKFAFLLIAHTCLRNSPLMIDSIRNEKELTFSDTIALLAIFERTGCFINQGR